jgi:hypothetical protein
MSAVCSSNRHASERPLNPVRRPGINGSALTPLRANPALTNGAWYAL